MSHDAIVLEDMIANHPAHFVLGVGPVGAGAIENGDAVAGHDLFDLGKQDRKDTSRGHRPGDVTDRDPDGIVATEPLGEWWGAYRVPEGFAQGVGFVGQAGNEPWFDNGGAVGGQVDGEAGAPVGEVNLHLDVDQGTAVTGGT